MKSTITFTLLFFASLAFGQTGGISTAELRPANYTGAFLRLQDADITKNGSIFQYSREANNYVHFIIEKGDTTLKIGRDYFELKVGGSAIEKQCLPEEVPTMIAESFEQITRPMTDELEILRWKVRYYESQYGELIGKPYDECTVFVPVKSPVKPKKCTQK